MMTTTTTMMMICVYNVVYSPLPHPCAYVAGSGLLLPAVCLLAVGYIGCDVNLAVFLLVSGVGLLGLTTCVTSGSNQLDLATHYAGQCPPPTAQSWTWFAARAGWLRG